MKKLLRGAKYPLSKVIPVHFTTRYRPSEEPHETEATWWQWRGRCFGVAHRPVGA